MQLSAASVVYVLLATGVVLPISVAGVVLPLHTIAYMLLISALLIREEFQFSFGRSILFMLPFSIVMLMVSFASPDEWYLVSKFEGAVLSTILAAGIISYAMIRWGEDEFLRAFLVVASIVLVLTVAYKFSFGIDDRSVRFFMNGPIVFAWIMGLCALICIVRPPRELGTYKRAAMIFCFVSAAIWTESKGPLLALVVALGVHVLVSGRVRSAILATFTGLLIVVLVYRFAPEDTLERFSAISRLLAGRTTAVDEGSIGTRELLFGEAIKIWQQNPFFGAGLASWPSVSAYGFDYPHNVTLEILAEAGLALLVPFMAMVLFLLVNTSPLGRIVLIYFFICTSLSGDISYLRFLLSFPVAAYLHRAFLRHQGDLR